MLDVRQGTTQTRVTAHAVEPDLFAAPTSIVPHEVADLAFAMRTAGLESQIESRRTNAPVDDEPLHLLALRFIAAITTCFAASRLRLA